MALLINFGNLSTGTNRAHILLALAQDTCEEQEKGESCLADSTEGDSTLGGRGSAVICQHWLHIQILRTYVKERGHGIRKKEAV